MSTATAQPTTDAVVNESASTSSEPIVKSGTGNELTISDFDDLEAATTKQKVASENAKLDVKRKEFADKQKAKREKAETEVDDDMGLDEESDQQSLKDEKEEPKKEGKEKEEETEKDKEKEIDTPPKEEATAEKAKVLKVQVNGKVQDLPENAALPVKINGKTEHIQVKDLLSNYSGKVVWEEKFRTLDLERKTFHNERDSLQSGINKLHELAISGNPRAAIEYLAEAMGADPIKVWGDLKKEVATVIKQYSDLTPEQIQALELKEENEYLRRKDESAKAATLRQQEFAETETTVRAIQETLGIDKKQFVELYDELVSEARRAGKDENLITPGLVRDYYQVKLRTQEVRKILSKDFSNRGEAEALKYGEMLLDVWKRNPEFTTEQIRDIAKEAFSVKKQSSLAKKVVKNRSEQNEMRQPQTDPMDWDSV